jgi:sugar lactone lactonase YvrE
VKIWTATLVGGFWATAVLAACSPVPKPLATVAAAPTPSPTPAPIGSPSPGATPTPTPRATATPSPAPTATPTSSVLASSSIFVAESGDNNITIYPPNPAGTVNELPVTQINGANTELSLPFGVAVDGTGKIYVANRTGAGSGSVTVYAANPTGTVNATPLATIAGSNTGLNDPQGIAVDASGKFYVSNITNTITVYAANPSGTLNEAPLATIAGANTQLASPFGMAFDAAGRLYVANELSASITVYAANPSGTLDEAPLAAITGSNTGLDNPGGVALDASGQIYAVNSGPGVSSVTVYAANPSGTMNEAPTATISGSATQLGSPSAVTLDSTGKIYVVNTYGGGNNTGAITIFAANPSGTLNEAPLGTITGSNSRLFNPTGIAVH